MALTCGFISKFEEIPVMTKVSYHLVICEPANT